MSLPGALIEVCRIIFKVNHSRKRGWRIQIHPGEKVI
jgi:hypothetical protein